MRERERERERVCVCVRVREIESKIYIKGERGERERDISTLTIANLFNFYWSYLCL